MLKVPPTTPTKTESLSGEEEERQLHESWLNLLVTHFAVSSIAAKSTEHVSRISYPSVIFGSRRVSLLTESKANSIASVYSTPASSVRIEPQVYSAEDVIGNSPPTKKSTRDEELCDPSSSEHSHPMAWMRAHSASKRMRPIICVSGTPRT